MITFTGTHVTREFGAPSIRDIAVQSMRIVRFSGGGDIFWPIGMHMMFVADMLPEQLKIHGLLHDASEVCVADVPRPMKTDQAREVEDAVLDRIYKHLGAPALTDAIKKAVKVADFRAALAEGVMGCCGRGFAQTQVGFRHDDDATEILAGYLRTYHPADAIDPDGPWPLMYETRLRNALRVAQNGKEKK